MRQCVAFQGCKKIGSGGLDEIALQVKELFEQGTPEPLLIFDDVTSEVIDLDLSGTAEELLRKATGDAPETSGDAQRGPGRPRLGVVAREITLLPRHWEWLNRQPGGASVALRKLVEEARRANAAVDRVREAREAVYRFISAMAGNEPGFEEATRALFAGNSGRFEELVRGWPVDIQGQAKKLAAVAHGEPMRLVR
jgi:hypothetical protein